MWISTWLKQRVHSTLARPKTLHRPQPQLIELEWGQRVRSLDGALDLECRSLLTLRLHLLPSQGPPLSQAACGLKLCTLSQMGNINFGLLPPQLSPVKLPIHFLPSLKGEIR